jgi:PKD repeat protein
VGDLSFMDRFARLIRRPSNIARSAQVAVAALVAFSLIVVAAWAEEPNARFELSPTNPVEGELVTFTSTSTDEDGDINSITWDLDDNSSSFNDGSGPTASKRYDCDVDDHDGGPPPCSITARIRVQDRQGDVDTASRSFTVRANTPPVAAFSVNPESPQTGQEVTLTSSSSDPDGRPLTERWDTDGNGSYETAGSSDRKITLSFPENEVRTVGLQVTDSGGTVRTTTRNITIRNRLPVASFDASAQEIDTGEPVEFTSTSTDPDGQVQTAEWDLDGDGEYDDATGNEVTHSFTDDGSRSVGLMVTDDDGGSDATSDQVTVRNRRPTASFTYTPNAPFAGDEIVLTSTSTDSDGQIEEYEWDFDGDVVVLDDHGPEARIRFDQPGSYQVGLKVTDDDDRESEVFDTIDVAPRPAPGQPSPPGGDPGGGTGNAVRRALIPFPTVRIRGVTTATGARIDLLSVRTPGGVRILVRCRGRSCPYARRLRRARFAESQVRTIKLPGFNRRHLRAGTVIQIFVIDNGVIGKYTRFEIRRALRPPRRIDRCAAPGRFRVRSCPG